MTVLNLFFRATSPKTVRITDQAQVPYSVAVLLGTDKFDKRCVM